MCNLCSNPSLQFLYCSPMKINWIPSCNQWMCKVLYQQCSRTICQACSMVLFHLYLGFLCHNQLWWCGTRDFKKRKGGREWYCSKNFTGLTTNPSQNIWTCHVESSLLKFCPFSCLGHQTWLEMLRKQKGGVFLNTRQIFMRANLQRFDRQIKFS
jgi:hypothetical protein